MALRVESLARSRADIVTATDAERRRIERDLRDGTQQRLLSLAMNLGMARATVLDAATETLNTYGHLWPDSEDDTRRAVDAVLTGIGG